MNAERPDTESKARVERLRNLRGSLSSPKNKHVHVSGICGTGVSAVAVLLKTLGFRVTGTDKAFYPPMGELARKTAEKLYTGYAESNLDERPDFVIIGNNLSRTNPEVERVLREGIPYASMPEAFEALLIGTRDECAYSIVVSGTHGKTTTSAAVSTLLEVGGFKPGYFIGGIPIDLPGNIRAVDSSFALEKRAVVLEGDEYDSAFFAKWSKFHSYRPDIAIVTSIEFDHADIFPSIKEIEEEFFLFLKKVPASGVILFWDGQARLKQLAAEWKLEFAAPIEFYGELETSRYRLVSREVEQAADGPRQRLRISLDGEIIEALSPMTGRHNALNLTVAAVAARRVGVTNAKLAEGIADFHGVLRRQRILGEFAGVLLIEDFAHHPSAVLTTLEGIKEAYPARRIIGIFEPRSNTSKRNYFQKEYEQSFGAADITIIARVLDASGYSKTATDFEALNVDSIARAIQSTGKVGLVLDSVQEIESWIQENARIDDLILLMSNGDFGGLPEKLPKLLENRSA